MVVLDEAQRIRIGIEDVTAVKKLRSRYAIVLTRHAAGESSRELYIIVQLVDDRRLGPAFEFLHEHRVLATKAIWSGIAICDRIRKKLAPILLRRIGPKYESASRRTDSTRFVEVDRRPAHSL